MRSHRQKRSAQHPRPERIALTLNSTRSSKQLKLPRRRTHRPDCRPLPVPHPPALTCDPKRRHRHHRPTHVDRHLHHIRPHHRRHPTFKRVQQRQRRNDRDRQHITRSDSNPHHDRHGEHPHTLRRRPRQQKQPRRHLVQRMSQTAGRSAGTPSSSRPESTSAGIAAPPPPARSCTQTRPVEIPRSPANAIPGIEMIVSVARLRTHNRQPNRPPRNRPPCQKIPAQRLILRPAKSQPKQRNPHQVSRNHNKIQRTQPRRQPIRQTHHRLAAADTVPTSLPVRVEPVQIRRTPPTRTSPISFIPSIRAGFAEAIRTAASNPHPVNSRTRSTARSIVSTDPASTPFARQTPAASPRTANPPSLILPIRHPRRGIIESVTRIVRS